MTHTHMKGQSIRKIEWKQTDGQTDGGNCITSRYSSVSELVVMGVARTFDWGEGPMYDVVEIVQFYQTNVQCMRTVRTSFVLNNFWWIGLGSQDPQDSPLATPMLVVYTYVELVELWHLPL